MQYCDKCERLYADDDPHKCQCGVPKIPAELEGAELVLKPVQPLETIKIAYKVTE